MLCPACFVILAAQRGHRGSLVLPVYLFHHLPLALRRFLYMHQERQHGSRPSPALPAVPCLRRPMPPLAQRIQVTSRQPNFCPKN